MNGYMFLVSVCIVCHTLHCTHAQDIDDCGSNSCYNGGICIDGVNNYTCNCANGFTGDRCQKNFNECNSNPCHHGGTCTDGVNSYTCSCAAGYTGKQCLTNINDCNSNPCQNSGTCTDGVNSFTCKCVTGYIGDRCQTNIDDCSPNPCLNGGSCTDVINNFVCNCRSGFSSETCSVADLGVSCAVQGTTCKDPNSDCGSGNICICKSSYYDDNGLSIGGTCRQVSNLRVTNIGFSVIKTNAITVSWTTSENYKQFINSFNVTWRATNDNKVYAESENLGSTTTSYTLTRRIDPGRAYTVTIISINDQTQQGSQRTTSIVRYQAAKPGIASGIDESKSDKDASGGTITVVWANVSGYKSGYIVKLIDGETIIQTKYVGSVSATFSSSGLKHGYNYTVTIQAKSEVYDTSKTELGEIFFTVFKTTPTIPGPPRNGVCNNPTDKSIDLSWEAPAKPNGYLVQYKTHVLRHGVTVYTNVVTTATETSKTVGNLGPGTIYTFRIYTVNEVGQSETYLTVSTNCKTNVQVSAEPENLQISVVTSRSFYISWDKPVETYSAENYGYVLQVKDDTENCKKEILYKCSDCEGSFQVTDLTGLCDSQKQPDFYMTKAKLARALSYNASLDPDINYTVTVTAITDAGRGYPATKKQRTNEEAPQTPYGVNVMIFNATALYVTWKIDGPRPGKTDYLISLLAEDPARSKNFTITGFDVREYTASGLEEYWNYNVLLTVSTSVGSRKSEVTNQYRTLPAAPGKVSEFNIESRPGGDYTMMKISWKMPTVLERNGIITSYKFEYFETAMVTSTIDLNQAAEGNIYTVTIDVKPEEIYNITVYAINEDGMEGEKYSVVIQAPAGGAVKALTNFNSMKNLKEDKEAYRPTNEAWLIDTIQNNAAINRRKRSLTYLEYTVGSDKCPELTSDKYCNGPLQTGKSYYIFAVSCTNGGCLVSEPNGPFITKAAQVTAECNCSTQSVVIGAVLGLIILILLVYAGYTTITIRRIRIEYGQKIINSNKNRHTSQTYVNETFGTGLSGVLNERNVEHPGIAAGYTETEYSTLDNDSREDKATYDILIPGYEK